MLYTYIHETLYLLKEDNFLQDHFLLSSKEVSASWETTICSWEGCELHYRPWTSRKYDPYIICTVRSKKVWHIKYMLVKLANKLFVLVLISCYPFNELSVFEWLPSHSSPSPPYFSLLKIDEPLISAKLFQFEITDKSQDANLTKLILYVNVLYRFKHIYINLYRNII